MQGECCKSALFLSVFDRKTVQNFGKVTKNVFALAICLQKEYSEFTVLIVSVSGFAAGI